MNVIEYTGGKITQPGIYKNIPIEVYHHSPDLFDGPSISNTGLRKIEKCPEKFWGSCPWNPDATHKKESDDLKFGRMAHAFAVENRWPSDVIISPYDDVRSAAARDWKAAMEGSGKTVFKEKEIEHIRGMAERLAREPLMDLALAGGIIEASLIWKDEATGIWVKSRPDMIPNDNILADYKTTKSADPDAIPFILRDYGYHCQLALMAEGMAVVCGRVIESFSLVLQEKTPPYTVTVAALHDEDIMFGARKNREALDRLARYLEENDWPGYSEGPVTVRLPESELKRLRDQEKMLPMIPTLAEMAQSATTT